MIVEKPIRVQRVAEQSYASPAEEVFDLLCPVRECEWVEGWDPEVVWSDSGLIEPGCVFTTYDGRDRAVWTTVDHDREQLYLRLLKVLPDVSVCDIRIQLTPDGESRCRARLTYGHTALGPRGVGVCKDFTEQAFLEFSQRWEQALNDHLQAASRG